MHPLSLVPVPPQVAVVVPVSSGSTVIGAVVGFVVVFAIVLALLRLRRR